MRAKLVAREERGGFRENISVEFVDADVLYADIGRKGVEHFALGFADVALQFGEHRDGSNGRHGLKHVFLPVLADVILAFGHVGGEIGGDNGAASAIGDEGSDEITEMIHATVEDASAQSGGVEHDHPRGFEIVLVLNVVRVAVGAVGFAGDGPFKFVDVTAKAVGGVLHSLGFVPPRFDFGGIFAVLCC